VVSVNGTTPSATQIQQSFGLTWDPSFSAWVYAGPTGSAALNSIATLGSITGREPNFFELLKAAMLTGGMAREQVALLREENPTQMADVQIAENVVVEGDEELLRVVMQNLLANAWKFTSKRETAQISFGTTTQPDGSTAYFVRDNGAGFDPDQTARLFGPFQRLHGVKDFPGSGVGLATVKRIIHRHGGQVWAEAAVNHGATFFFTLAPAEAVRPSFAAIRDGRG
jgi:signal transduction histidine kinase